MPGPLPHDVVGALLDPESPSFDAGTTARLARIDGRPVAVYAVDRRTGPDGWRQAAALVRRAAAESLPVVGCYGDVDPTGRRTASAEEVGTDRDAPDVLAAVGELLAASTAAAGRPRVAVITGETGGAAAFAAATADLVIMVGPGAALRVVDAATVALATGDDLDTADLAGADVHTTRTGLAQLRAEDPEDAAGLVADLLDLLADDRRAPAGTEVGTETGTGSGSRPDGRDRLLDDLLDDLVDPVQDGLFDGDPGDDVPDDERAGQGPDRLELHPDHAPGLLTAFGRVGGRTVGLLGTRGDHLGGALDNAAVAKAARFVTTCDTLGLPVITVVDVPGFVPGVGEEWSGLARRGAELAAAYARARVPRITVITGQAAGPAGLLLGSRAVGADLVLAWPDAVVEPAQVDRVIGPAETRAVIMDALRPAGLPGRPATDRSTDAGPTSSSTVAGDTTPGMPAARSNSAVPGTAGDPVRIVRGRPSDAELAAVITVLAAARRHRTTPSGPRDPDPAVRHDGWSRHWRGVGSDGAATQRDR